MKRASWCSILVGIGVLGFLIAPGNRVNSQHATTNQTSEEKEIPIIDMKQGPIALFEDACARCHGPFGSFYGEEFANLDDHHLEEVVYEMMVGPSQLDPNETEIKAMTVYHRALNEQRLFVSVNNGKSLKQGKAEKVVGDKSPDSNVIILKDEVTHQPIEDNYTWSLERPLSPPFEVIVKKKKKQESFQFPQRQWNEIVHQKK